MSWDKDEKNVVRDQLFRTFDGHGPQDVLEKVLMMPGRDMFDVRQLVSLGLLVPGKSEVHVIERDKAVCKDIAAGLKKMRLEHVIFNCDLETWKPRLTDETSSRDHAVDTYDMAYLDTCSTLNRSLYAQLIRFGEWRLVDGPLILNTAGFLRSNKLGSQFTEYDEPFDRIISRVPVISIDGVLADRDHRIIIAMLTKVFGRPTETFIYRNASSTYNMHTMVCDDNRNGKSVGSAIHFLEWSNQFYAEKIQVSPIGHGAKAALTTLRKSYRENESDSNKINRLEAEIAELKGRLAAIQNIAILKP